MQKHRGIKWTRREVGECARGRAKAKIDSNNPSSKFHQTHTGAARGTEAVPLGAVEKRKIFEKCPSKRAVFLLWIRVSGDGNERTTVYVASFLSEESADRPASCVIIASAAKSVSGRRQSG